MKALTWTGLLPLLLIPLLLAATPARANDQSDRLVALLQYRQQFEDAYAYCEKKFNSVTPEAYYRRDPKAFYGLGPQSRQWPEAVAIYRAYIRDRCAYIAPADYTHAMSAQYAKDLSPQDLQAAIRFYASPAGRHLVQAHRALNKSMLAREYADNHKAHRQAGATYVRKMKQLARQAGELQP